MNDPDGHADRRAFRAGRVRLAFLSSGASKGLGLLVQFLAIPLAVRALGPERFGLYTMLISALVWIDLGRVGIGPGLTREMAIAWNSDKPEVERRLFSNATLLLTALALAICLVIGGSFAFGLWDVEAVFGAAGLRHYDELRWGLLVVSAFLILQIVFSAGEAARSAYQEDYINNLMNALANFTSLALIFYTAFFLPTIWAFAFAVVGAIALAKGVNLALLLLHSRPHLLPRFGLIDVATLKLLLGTSLAFWVIQIATLLMHNLTLIQLGRTIGAAELTPFAVVFRLIQLISTAVLMVTMPLWPAITDAVVRKDIEWISRVYRRLIAGVLAFAILVALVLATLGPTLIPFWAGPDVVVGQALAGTLGVYFVIWMWNHAHSAVLFGLGKLWQVALAMLAEGVLVLLAAHALIPHFGAVGTALALCLGGLAVTAWVLPLLVWRSLRQGADLAKIPPDVSDIAIPRDMTV